MIAVQKQDALNLISKLLKHVCTSVLSKGMAVFSNSWCMDFLAPVLMVKPRNQGWP